MAYSKQYMERRAAGLCVDCGAPALQGHLRCEKCLERKKLMTAEYRLRKKQEEKMAKKKNLSETITAATEAGMTYGQYVAQNSEGMKWRINPHKIKS